MQTNFYTHSMQLRARYAFRYPVPCDSSESDAMWAALAGEN